MNLLGKVAIVTGASRGIGKAIALKLAENGANVVVAARTEKNDKEDLPGNIYDTMKMIDSSGGRGLAVKCDVTSEESVNEMIHKTLAAFGQIDVLVNNAGVAFYYPVKDTPLKRWQLVLNINLTGTFLCSKAVLNTMIEQKRGSIINISSQAAIERGTDTIPTGLAYASAKAGVERFTFGLAAEVGKYGIAVNCVKPHFPIETEGMKFWVPKEQRKGWASPDKIANCVVFLSKQDAKAITGVVATDEELYLWHGL